MIRSCPAASAKRTAFPTFLIGRRSSCAAEAAETRTSGFAQAPSLAGARLDQKMFTSLAPSCEPPYQAAQSRPSDASQTEATCTLRTRGSGGMSSALKSGAAATAGVEAGTTNVRPGDLLFS